jgi:hypothetical protein
MHSSPPRFTKQLSCTRIERIARIVSRVASRAVSPENGAHDVADLMNECHGPRHSGRGAAADGLSTHRCQRRVQPTVDSDHRHWEIVEKAFADAGFTRHGSRRDSADVQRT